MSSSAVFLQYCSEGQSEGSSSEHEEYYISQKSLSSRVSWSALGRSHRSKVMECKVTLLDGTDYTCTVEVGADGILRALLFPRCSSLMNLCVCFCSTETSERSGAVREGLWPPESAGEGLFRCDVPRRREPEGVCLLLFLRSHVSVVFSVTNSCFSPQNWLDSSKEIKKQISSTSFPHRHVHRLHPIVLQFWQDVVFDVFQLVPGTLPSTWSFILRIRRSCLRTSPGVQSFLKLQPGT